MTLVFMRLAISTCLLASAVSGSISVLGAQERTVTVSVAARALVRGDTLQASDIATMDTTNVWRWNSVAPDTTRAIASPPKPRLARNRTCLARSAGRSTSSSRGIGTAVP